VAQIALVTLELILGRRLRIAEFPDGLRGLLDEAVERLTNSTVRPLSAALTTWFERALPLQTRRPFNTALDAQVALEEAIKKERAYAPSSSALKAFLQRFEARRDLVAPAVPETGGASAANAAVAVTAPAAAAPPKPRPPARARRSTPVPPKAGPPPRRLTPEEEEEEEIKALEAELARLARLEADEATRGVANPPTAEPPPPAAPEMVAADLVTPTDEAPPAAEPAPPEEELPASIDADVEADTPPPEAHALPATPMFAPAVAQALVLNVEGDDLVSTEVADASAPSEVIEFILPTGHRAGAAPRGDVAVDGDVIVVDDVGSTTEPAEEAPPAERVVEPSTAQMTSAKGEGPPVGDVAPAEGAPAVGEVAASAEAEPAPEAGLEVEPEPDAEPAWMLMAPDGDSPLPAEPVEQPEVFRDEWTLELDWDAEPEPVALQVTERRLARVLRRSTPKPTRLRLAAVGARRGERPDAAANLPVRRVRRPRRPAGLPAGPAQRQLSASAWPVSSTLACAPSSSLAALVADAPLTWEVAALSQVLALESVASPLPLRPPARPALAERSTLADTTSLVLVARAVESFAGVAVVDEAAAVALDEAVAAAMVDALETTEVGPPPVEALEPVEAVVAETADVAVVDEAAAVALDEAVAAAMVDALETTEVGPPLVEALEPVEAVVAETADVAVVDEAAAVALDEAVAAAMVDALETTEVGPPLVEALEPVEAVVAETAGVAVVDEAAAVALDEAVAAAMVDALETTEVGPPLVEALEPVEAVVAETADVAVVDEAAAVALDEAVAAAMVDALETTEVGPPLVEALEPVEAVVAETADVAVVDEAAAAAPVAESETTSLDELDPALLALLAEMEAAEDTTTTNVAQEQAPHAPARPEAMPTLEVPELLEALAAIEQGESAEFLVSLDVVVPWAPEPSKASLPASDDEPLGNASAAPVDLVPEFDRPVDVLLAAAEAPVPTSPVEAAAADKKAAGAERRRRSRKKPRRSATPAKPTVEVVRVVPAHRPAIPGIVSELIGPDAYGAPVLPPPRPEVVPTVVSEAVPAGPAPVTRGWGSVATTPSSDLPLEAALQTAPEVASVEVPPAAATCDSPASTLSLFAWADEVTVEEPEAAAERTGEPVRRRLDWRNVNWRRTAAAVIVLAFVEGAAFAAAYWFVRPTELGVLRVSTTTPGVEVVIDGRSAGKTPLSLELRQGRYTIELRGRGRTKVVPVEIAAGVQTSQLVKWSEGRSVGTLKVTSTPPGARVVIGGLVRGTTPLEIEDLPAGSHEVLVESDAGSVRESVRVRADDVVEVDIPVFSGWLAVFAPVELRIFEQGRMIGTTADGRIMMPPGRHDVELVNASLGIRQNHTVEIRPGRVEAISLEAPNGTLDIDAPVGTEVVVNGQRLGVTPLEALTLPVGTHEVTLRHPILGQRRVVVSVGAGVPAKVSLLAPQ
jgi:hypothetical protein